MGNLSSIAANADHHLRFAEVGDLLPPEINRLHPRMREIASIVYLSGGATAKDVQEQIDDPLTIYGIRTMLNRLANKGLVKRRRSGRHSEIMYLPGLMNDPIKAIALRRLIAENFEGSVSDALQFALRLLSTGRPGVD